MSEQVFLPAKAPVDHLGLDEFRLDGKVSLVTGAGGGIGEAFADVSCIDIVESKAEQIAAQVRELGKRPVAITADVS